MTTSHPFASPLGPGREFDRIRAIAARLGDVAPTLGDDCALLGPTGETLVLSTDLMIEDFEVYNGRVNDYTWEYAGTRNRILPFYDHNKMPLSSDPPDEPDGYKFVDVHGRGNCFPKVTYQLRKTYTLVGKPKDPNHPIGKRVINLDAETMTMASLSVYDRKGDLWKWFPIGKTHSDNHIAQNKGKGVALDDYAVLVDIQADHCTTLQFKSIITDDVNQPSLFNRAPDRALPGGRPAHRLDR